MDTRKLIDYAMDGDASAFREALYSQIHDRVSAHIEAKKQEIAQNLIAQEEVIHEENHDDEAEDRQLVRKMVKKGALKQEEEEENISPGPMKNHEKRWHMKKEEIEQLDEIGDTPEGKAKLQSYQDKAHDQVVKHWADVHDKSYERPDTKMVKRNQGVSSAGRRISGFGPDPLRANKVTGRFEYRKAVGKSHVYKNLGNKE
jgi:hypothetical protein